MGDYLRHFNFADSGENVLNEADILKNNEDTFCFNEFSFDAPEKKQEKKKKEKKQTKKQIIIENTDKDCPGRHGLIESQASDSRVMSCNECDKIMYLEEALFGCKWCDYNLCVQCFKGESAQNDDADNEKEDDNKDFDECKTMRSEDKKKEETVKQVNISPPSPTKQI